MSPFTSCFFKENNFSAKIIQVGAAYKNDYHSLPRLL